MKQRIMILGLAAMATGLLTANTPVEAVSTKHLVVVHAIDNTGQGVVSVDRARLHPYRIGGGGPADCTSAACGASYAAGTRVTLTATAADGSTFVGWGGECSGTAPTCVVRMDRSRDVMVHFGK